jgi:hypothetical protein
MAIRFALCVILIATAARAEWKRYVQMPHGHWADSPPVHDLAYFKVDPCLRSDTSDRVLQCDQRPSPAELIRQSRTRTKLRTVGKIGAFTIYDFEYFFSGLPPGPGMRSVLVETAPNQFHEIHVEQWTPLPTQILYVPQQPVIKVKYDDGGNYRSVNEDYFVIVDNEAALLDFEPVFQAAEKVTPRDMVMWQPMSRWDFKSFVFHIQTEKRHPTIGPKVACCMGRIEVPF